MKYLFLFLFSFFLNTSVNAADAVCVVDGNSKFCICPTSEYPILDGDKCIAGYPTDSPEPNEPHCIDGFDSYRINGSIVCYKKCPAPYQRDYHYETGEPLNSCMVACGPRGDYHWGYDDSKKSCTYTCTFSEEMVDGTCKQKCNADQVRNSITGICEVPQEPEPEPEPEECEGSVIESIQCLKNKVSNSLDDLKNSFTTGFDSFNDLLNQLLEKDNSTPSEPKPDSDYSDLDPNELNAETPFSEISPMSLTENNFNSSSSCPGDNSIDVWGHVYSFSYARLCESLETISYFLLALAYCFAAFIIVRKS